MHKRFLVAALGGGIALAGCGGGAGNGSGGGATNDAITMISDSVGALQHLRAAPAGTTNWSQDLLNGRYLLALETKQVFLVRPESQCLYDFTFDTTHHETFYVRGQDLCQHDVVHLRTGR